MHCMHMCEPETTQFYVLLFLLPLSTAQGLEDFSEDVAKVCLSSAQKKLQVHQI